MDCRQRFRVKSGRRVDLTKLKTDDTAGVRNKAHTLALLKSKVERLAALQDRMYAQATTSVLVILQAMDAAGKDSTIRHVMSGIDPRGCPRVGATSTRAWVRARQAPRTEVS